GARRPDHEDAPGADGAGGGVPLGMLEEVDDLGDLLLRPLVTGHVAEARLRTLLVVDLRPGGPDAHEAPGQLAGGPPADPEVDAEQDEEGKEPADHADQARRVALSLHGDVVRGQVPGQAVVLQRRRDPAGVGGLVGQLAGYLARWVDGGV